MTRVLLAVLLALIALPALAAPTLDGFVARAKTKTPMAMVTPQAKPGDTVTMTFSTPRRARVDVVRLMPDATKGRFATVFDLEPAGADVRVRMSTEANGQMKPAFTCLTQLDSTAGALTGGCWPTPAFEARGTSGPAARLSWTIGPQGSTIRLERDGRAMLAISPSPTATVAAPAGGPAGALTFQARFTAALKAVAAYKVGEETGVLIGDATVAGRTIPLVSVTVSDVADGAFSLTRKMLLGPPEQKETRWDFRVTGLGGNADELRYAVTQTQLSTAGQPKVATECLARRAASGAVTMQCVRPEIARLGPSFAQPSFTFAFRPWPLFQIDIGPGLDNIFTVKTESEFRTPKP